MLDYFLNDNEIMLKKNEKKKKLNELLDKYGSVEEIEKKAIGADGYEYMFANTNNLIDEVLQERRLGESLLSPVRKDTPQKRNKLLPDDEDFSLDGLTLSERQKKAIKNLDMANQLTVIKALREQQNIEPPHQTAKRGIEKMTAENKRNNDLRIHKAEKQYASNEYAGIKNDAEVDNNRNVNDEKMKKAITDLSKKRNGGLSFHDIYHAVYKNGHLIQNATENAEGGYINDSNDYGGSTNMGITQKTLNEYKNKFKASYKSNIVLPESVKDLTKNQAMVILNEMFFRPYNINFIPDKKISRIAFDSCMLAGPKMNKAFTDKILKITGLSLSDITKDKKTYENVIKNINTVIPSDVTLLTNTLTEKQKTELADYLLKVRMEHHFNFIEKEHTQINFLEGWYERAKSLYSDKHKFDELYLEKRNDFLTKYEDYLNKIAYKRHQRRKEEMKK